MLLDYRRKTIHKVITNCSFAVLKGPEKFGASCRPVVPDLPSSSSVKGRFKKFFLQKEKYGTCTTFVFIPQFITETTYLKGTWTQFLFD